MSLFNNNNFISIDFDDMNFSIIEGKRSKKTASIINQFELDVDTSIYVDGNIRNMEKLGEILKKNIVSNGIKADNVIAVVNSSLAVIREVTIPKIGEKEIDALLEFQLEDFMPIKAEDYVVQYSILDTIFEDETEKLKLLLIGFPKNIVESHLALIENMGYKPKAMDFQGNALGKVLQLNSEINNKYTTVKKTVICLDLGYINTRFNLYEKNQLKISRILNIGLSNVIEDVKSTLNVSEEEAKGLVKDLSEVKKHEVPLEDEALAATADIFDKNVNLLLEEVEMIFRYYNSREMNNKVDLILLHGKYSNFMDIPKRFSDFFTIDTDIIKSVNLVDSSQDLSLYINAVGGLIRKSGV